MKQRKEVKRVKDTATGEKIRVYVIQNQQRDIVALVHVYIRGTSQGYKLSLDIIHPRSDVPIQQSWSVGCGYDLLTYALSGCIIDGHRLYDHAECVSNGVRARPGFDSLRDLGYIVTQAF